MVPGCGSTPTTPAPPPWAAPRGASGVQALPTAKRGRRRAGPLRLRRVGGIAKHGKQPNLYIDEKKNLSFKTKVTWKGIKQTVCYLLDRMVALHKGVGPQEESDQKLK